MLDTDYNQPIMDIKRNYENEKIGLINLGNTSYMNSFLQIVLHTPGFLVELKKERDSNIELVDSLIGISENSDNIKYLKKIKQIMGNVKDEYGEYVQNDSQEFGTDLINTLITSIKGDPSFSDEKEKEEERITNKNKNEIKKKKFDKYIKKYYNKEKEIPLEKMFQFHESKIEIESEENNEITEIKNINFETFINIDIDFQTYKKTDLVDLLTKKYFDYFYKENEIKLEIPKDSIDITDSKEEQETPKKEEEEDTSKLKVACNAIKGFFSSCFKLIYFLLYFCSGNYEDSNECLDKKKEELIVIKKIATLPKILIISVNRAFLNKNFNDNIITFSDTLDVKKFIDNDLLKPKNTEYKLYGINICEAHTKNYGHCYSFIKIDNNWYKFNDSVVKQEQPNFSSRYVVGLYYINNNL